MLASYDSSITVMQVDEMPKSLRTTESSSEADHRQLFHLAQAKKVSLTWVICDAVDNYLENQRLLLGNPENPSEGSAAGGKS